jgi:hypothetical protein
LDKLITNYYLQNARDGVSVSMEQKRQWEILKHIFPVAWQHINFYGRYEFNTSSESINMDAIILELAKFKIVPNEWLAYPTF